MNDSNGTPEQTMPAAGIGLIILSVVILCIMLYLMTTGQRLECWTIPSLLMIAGPSCYFIGFYISISFFARRNGVTFVSELFERLTGGKGVGMNIFMAIMGALGAYKALEMSVGCL